MNEGRFEGLQRCRLACGTGIVLRDVRPEDGHWLEEGLRTLSRRSRFQRFLQVRNSFTARELAYLTGADGKRHIAIGALRTNPEGREVEPLGVARCIRDAADPATAEVAVAVADAWQRKGLGTVLMRTLTDRAHAADIRRWKAYYLADNTAAVRLLQRVSKQESKRFIGRDLIESVWRITPPDTAPTPTRRTE